MVLKTSLILVLLLCESIVAQTLYSVVLNSPETDTAVVIDNQIYKLEPSGKSDIVLQTKAPGEKPYFYAKLKKNTLEIVEQEDFIRSPVTKNWTFNEFYNRNWTHKQLLRFPVLNDFTPQFSRDPDTKLHPPNEITTLHITADQDKLDSINGKYLDSLQVKVNVTHISASTVSNFLNCDFGISGRTSRYFNKLPYKIKLPKTGPNIDGLRHIRLRTTENDPSYMRDYLTTEFLRATSQPGTRASYVRLFLNSRPIGLFTMIEKYDDYWLDKEFNPNKDAPYAHGNLYEGDGGSSRSYRADLSYKEGNHYQKSGYTIEEHEKGKEATFNQLAEFTKFIKSQTILENSENNTTAEMSEWEKHLDVDGFLANMALEFLLGFADGHLQNTNNYYIYKEPIQDRFIYIAWDFDYNFGNGPFSMRLLLEGDYKKFGWLSSLPLPSALLRIPAYRARFENQIELIANNLLNPVHSFPVIDSIVDLIRQDVEWDQTLPRVRTGPSFVEAGLQSLLEGKLDGNAIPPYATNYLSALDFIIRVNTYIDFDLAIEGGTGHKSVLGIKEFIRQKIAYYNVSK